MSGDFPDEWFRPAQAGAGDAPSRDAATPQSPVGPADERYTDQFKPNYVAQERIAGTRPTTDRPSAGGSATAAQATARPVTEPTARPQSPPSVVETDPGRRGASHSVGVAPGTTVDVVDERRRSRGRARRAIPFVVGVLALTGLGVVIGQTIGHGRATTNTTDPQISNAPAAQGTASMSPSSAPSPWTGAVKVVKATSVKASCTAPDQEGYDGSVVPSSASRLIDGEMSTGWRCNGDAQGQTLTFTFPKGTKVVGVRMTNGYTKQVDGTSLYPQYRRVTTVTWSFPSLEGAFFLQNLADNHPAVQEIRIPQTSADGGMQMQITTSTAPGSSDSTRNAVVLTDIEFLSRA